VKWSSSVGAKSCFLVVMLLAVTTGCGKNHGTPRPQGEAPTSANGDREVGDGASMQLADAQQWRAQLVWDNTPRYNDEEFVEMAGTVHIRGTDGKSPLEIVGIKITADMPQHGHGTGNILPQISPVAGTPGTFTFNNLFFTMQGLWRIQVSGSVDGRYDSWTTMVDVQ
jgi:hypothetical protein